MKVFSAFPLMALSIIALAGLFSAVYSTDLAAEDTKAESIIGAQKPVVISEDAVFTYIRNQITTVGDYARHNSITPPESAEVSDLPLLWAGPLKVGLIGDGIYRFGELIETSFRHYGELAGKEVITGSNSINVVVLADGAPFPKAQTPEYSRLFTTATGWDQTYWSERVNSAIHNKETCNSWIGTNDDHQIVRAYFVVDTSIPDEFVRRCIKVSVQALFAIRYTSDRSLEQDSNPILDHLAIWSLYGQDATGGRQGQLSEDSIRKQIKGRLSSLSAINAFLEKASLPAERAKLVAGLETAQGPLLMGRSLPMNVQLVEEELYRYGQSILAQIENFSASSLIPFREVGRDGTVLVIAIPDLAKRIHERPYLDQLRFFYGKGDELQKRISMIQAGQLDCWVENLGNKSGVTRSILLLQTNIPPETVRKCIRDSVPVLFGFSTQGVNARRQISDRSNASVMNLLGLYIANIDANNKDRNVKSTDVISKIISQALGG